MAASPSESTNTNTFNGHYPKTTDKVFLLILIFCINTFAIEYTKLVVYQTSATGIRQNVTLQLNTDVATTR